MPISSRPPSSRRRFLRRALALGGASMAATAAAAPAVPAVASPAAGDQVIAPDVAVPPLPAENAYAYRRNWGRWGANDQMGAVNLITPQKRVAAAALVRTGRTVSLGREFTPDQHFIRVNQRPTGASSVVDYYGMMYHGVAVTHLDALCHAWDRDGMWNGRDPAKEIDTSGAKFADITAFGGGLVTRGVLLDVPRFRRVSHVVQERPVEGSELEAIAQAQNVRVEPGDALFIYQGRESLVKATGPYGSAAGARPGLGVSCARFIRDKDVAILGWDMHDALPDRNGHPWPGHGVLYSYGVALLDNALLEPLAQACAEEKRYEFMFVASPLKVTRGTGSPANPVAIF